MAEGEEVVEVEEVVEPEDLTPSFRKAVFGIRSLDDIKALITHDEYDPHVHLIILLFAAFMVGAISFLVGA
jgi:hypothetical protein